MESNAVKALAFTFGFLVSLGLGVVCTFYPQKIQRLEPIGPINFTPPFEFLRRYKAQPGYIVNVRICGILCLLMAAADLYALVQLAIN